MDDWSLDVTALSKDTLECEEGVSVPKVFLVLVLFFCILFQRHCC
jgi:hypothetical protein